MWPPAKKIPAKNLRPHNSTCPLWETCDSSEDASCKKSKVPGPFKASAVSPGREVRSSSCRAVVQLGGVTLLDKRVGYLTPDINKKLADWRTPTPRWHGGLAGSQIEWADACKLAEGPWDTRSSTTSGQGGDDTHTPLGLDKAPYVLHRTHCESAGENRRKYCLDLDIYIWWSTCQDASWRCYTEPAAWVMLYQCFYFCLPSWHLSYCLCRLCIITIPSKMSSPTLNLYYGQVV